jgi:multisubunit Na+/H+ antiporter MnhE subunit
MLKGRTPGRGPDLVRNDRAPLAWLLAIAAALYWAWEIWRAMFAG